jgi:hypothetical protein
MDKATICSRIKVLKGLCPEHQEHLDLILQSAESMENKLISRKVQLYNIKQSLSKIQYIDSRGFFVQESLSNLIDEITEMIGNEDVVLDVLSEDLPSKSYEKALVDIREYLSGKDIPGDIKNHITGIVNDSLLDNVESNDEEESS